MAIFLKENKIFNPYNTKIIYVEIETTIDFKLVLLVGLTSAIIMFSYHTSIIITPTHLSVALACALNQLPVQLIQIISVTSDLFIPVLS